MTKDKRNKIVKIIGIIVLIYLSLDFGLRAMHLILKGFDFSSPYFPDSMKIHIYIATILKFVILLSLIFWVLRGLRKRKWISFPIAILVVFIVPKYISYLPMYTHAIAVANQTDTEKANYENIIQQQSKILDSSRKSIRLEKVYSFPYKNGKLQTKGNLSSVTEYDKNGNIIKENSKLYFYDTLNRMVKEIEPNINGQTDTILYSYNSNNLETERKYIANKYVRITKKDYDSNGNKIRQMSYMKGILESEFIWKYDSLNREISQIYHDYENDRVDTDTFIYIGNTKTTFESDFNGGIQKRVFAYDSLGNEIEQKVIDKNDKEKFSFIKNFNSAGKMISEYHLEDGKKSMEKEWNYDENGVLTYAIDYYGTGYLKRLEYSYINEQLAKVKIIDTKSNEPLYEKIYLYEFW